MSTPRAGHIVVPQAPQETGSKSGGFDATEFAGFCRRIFVEGKKRIVALRETRDALSEERDKVLRAETAWYWDREHSAARHLIMNRLPGVVRRANKSGVVTDEMQVIINECPGVFEDDGVQDEVAEAPAVVEAPSTEGK